MLKSRIKTIIFFIKPPFYYGFEKQELYEDDFTNQIHVFILIFIE